MKPVFDETTPVSGIITRLRDDPSCPASLRRDLALTADSRGVHYDVAKGLARLRSALPLPAAPAIPEPPPPPMVERVEPKREVALASTRQRPRARYGIFARLAAGSAIAAASVLVFAFSREQGSSPVAPLTFN